MRRLWQRFWDCSVRSKRREATWNLAASQVGAGATGYLIDDLRPAPGGLDAADFIGHSLRAGFLNRVGAPRPQRRTSFSIAYWTRSDDLRFVVVLTAGTNVGDDSRTLDEGGRITWRGFITLLSRRDPSPLLRKNFHHDLCGCLGAESSSISPRSNRFLIKCTPLPMNSFNTSRPCSAP